MDVQDAFLSQCISTVLFITATVLYLLYRWNVQNYWQRAGVPHVKPNWLFGSAIQNLKDTMHVQDVDRYNELGKVYGHFEAMAYLLAVGEPELLKKVFVKDFETFPKRQFVLGKPLQWGDPISISMLQRLDLEEWKVVRPILSPAFTTGKIRQMVDPVKSCVRTLLENLTANANKGEVIDLKWYFNAFVMDELSSNLYSIKIKDHNDPNNAFAAFGRSVFHKKLTWRSYVYYSYLRLKHKILKSFLKRDLTPPPFLRFFANAAFEAMDKRKESLEKKNDLLQLIMDASTDLAIESEKTVEPEQLLNNYGGEITHLGVQENAEKKTLTRLQVASQCALFFLAAFETTASCLSYTSYYLALYPDIQEKLIKELDEIINNCNGVLTYNAIQDMKYLDNVISESLRICPPIIRLTRVSNKDYDTGEFVIPKGTCVTVPVYALHNDPENFPDPERFDPDRFKPEAITKRETFTYMPFGAGPRHCIGMRFALLMMKLALAYILANYRMKKCSETQVPLELTSYHGLLYAKNIKIRLEPREDKTYIE